MSDTLSFLSATNPDYLAGLYARYKENPAMVHPSWSDLFSDLGAEVEALLDDAAGASWTPPADVIDAVLSTKPANRASNVPPPEHADHQMLPDEVAQAGADSLRAYLLIRSHQVRGHWAANLDPLGLMPRSDRPDLAPETFGFTKKDYSRPIMLEGLLGLESANLHEIMEIATGTYCGSIGVEFMHIQDPEQRAWLMERMESTRGSPGLSVEEKKYQLQRITATEGFEKFLDTKFPGTKRFGVEGGEATINAIEEVIARGASLGVREVVIGMAHRGRLNVLTNVMGKSFTAMFSEFQGGSFKPDAVQGSGDVKYHLGTSSDRDFNGNTVHLSLTPNPSHLEFVDPVVVGKVRAKQDIRVDKDRAEVLGLLLHGDAAVSGQGIVPETLMMSDLPGYRVGGTIHVVINNQIGFTTSPLYSRSGNYCTDVAKVVSAPIFHVNGDDVEAVVHVARIAAEYRQKFKRDVFIDIICYRRHGHNEGDEPSFTQPLMYKVIKEKRTTRDIYAERLVKLGILTQEEADQIYKDLNAQMEKEFEAATSYKVNRADMLEGQWSGLKVAEGGANRGYTAITKEVAQKLGKALTEVPEGFNLNSKIARQFKKKKEMFDTGEGFDWATAEALAFGSLLLEGRQVRLSGQDSERGTFSQRHAVVTDQENGKRYAQLNNIEEGQARFDVHNSPLSEAGVLGFEYGYSTAYPQSLIIWEAQFGDFVNGAQVIIDQFISSGETKWLRMSGLVMLLPHGFEGQGPEHSSARLERFLQSSAENNWQVVNCTTPASYFHALRRQIHRDFRKPLIVMTPKSLLRHKRCVSPLTMMTGNQTFHRVLTEDVPIAPPEEIKRVVLCSGKVFYDLEDARAEARIKDVALARLEQLYPFPEDAVIEELEKYPNVEKVFWCQEEPENQGSWRFIDRRIEQALKAMDHQVKRPSYAGRAAAASTATGSHQEHAAEQKALLHWALTG